MIAPTWPVVAIAAGVGFLAGVLVCIRALRRASAVVLLAMLLVTGAAAAVLLLSGNGR